MNFESNLPQCVNLSIETLVKETRHVVTEKHGFDNRDDSFLSTISGIFGLSGVCWRVLKKMTIQLNSIALL